MRTKKWRRPNLILLVRGRPDEMVLSACKQDGGGGGYQGNAWNRCNGPPDCNGGGCSNRTAS